jgi:hypothetical protein
VKVKVQNPKSTLVTIPLGTASVPTTIPATSPAASPPQVIYKRYAIKNNSLIWTIRHNQNTDRFVAVLRDEFGNQFNALIKTLDNKTMQIVLTQASKGFVDVIFDISNSPVIDIA